MVRELCPRKLEHFGSASSVHKHFLEWEKAGLRPRLVEYYALEGIAWRWQSIDETMMKELPKSRLARILRTGGKTGASAN